MNRRKHPYRPTIGEQLQYDRLQRERRTFGYRLGELIGLLILLAFLWIER